jgi:DNA-binding NarL/FixJ family response regulator
MRITEQEWLVGQQVCTSAQLRVLRLYRQGMPKRAIARLLGVAPSTVRDHFEAAARRIDSGLASAA